jgi:hypothetical protein
MAPVGTVALRALTVFYRGMTLYLRGINAIGRATHRVWTSVVKPVFGAFGDVVRYQWRRVIQPALQAFTGFLGRTVGPAVKFLWEKVIRPVFGWIGDKITNTWENGIRPTLVAFRDFIRQDLVPAVRRGIDRLGDIFDDLRKAAGTPVKFVVDTVYNNGLRKVINAIPGVDDVDPVDTSDWPSFARGGVLPGWTPGRDVHRFVSPTAGVLNLSGGEAVMRPEFTRSVGGSRGVALLNKLARAGRLSLGALLEQSHRAGGVVYVDGEPMSRVAAAQLAVAEHASGIPMRVIQGSYQAPSSYSGTSHTGGGVMDTSPGSFLAQGWLRRLAFAAWARNIAGAAYAGSGAHVHSVSLIDPAAAGNSQAAAYRAGGDGLGGRDYGPRPLFSPALVAAALKLAGSTNLALPANTSGGGNPLTKFLGAVDAVKDFAAYVPGMLKKLGQMGAWGKLMVTGVRSMGGGFRSWVNDKIPNRFLPDNPFPDVFDSGGLAMGRGYLAKRTIRPERVLDPAQTAAFERLVAVLDNTGRTERALAGAGAGLAGQPRLDVTRFRIVDWDKGLAELEYMASTAAQQVLVSHQNHDARIHDLDVDYG